MGKLEDNKARNRQAIVDAAFRVFARQGMDNTTIADIVSASGLARGTFYNYFRSVEEVWDAVMETFFARVGGEVHEVRRRAPDLRAFIKGAYRTYFGLVARDPDLLQLLVRNQSAVRNSFHEGPAGVSMYRQLETDMHASGFFTAYSPEQVRILSVAMIGAVSEILSQSMARGVNPDPELIASTLTALFIEGLRPAG